MCTFVSMNIISIKLLPYFVLAKSPSKMKKKLEAWDLDC